MLQIDETHPRPRENTKAFRILKAESGRLRDSIVALLATLLRNVGPDPIGEPSAAGCGDAERLIRDAEECFLCAKGLEALGGQFLTAAAHIGGLSAARHDEQDCTDK